MTMSADDYLSEWFESTEVKAVLAYYCGIGTFVGPKSPGSAYVVMHHLMGEHAGAGGWGFVRGGMGAITQAIAALRHGEGAWRSAPTARSPRSTPRTAARPASPSPTARVIERRHRREQRLAPS